MRNKQELLYFTGVTMEKMKEWRPFAGIFLLVLCRVQLCAAVSVSGKVADENGVAVAAARVEIRATPPVAVLSDVTGNFSAEVDKPGEYAVHAERTGFFVFDGRVELRE